MTDTPTPPRGSTAGANTGVLPGSFVGAEQPAEKPGAEVPRQNCGGRLYSWEARACGPRRNEVTFLTGVACQGCDYSETFDDPSKVPT